MAIAALNRALMSIPRRAESRQTAELRATFVDSGISDAMSTVDHQIIYGRRGTGKTHALRYLESVVTDAENIAVYLDAHGGITRRIVYGQTTSPR